MLKRPLKSLLTLIIVVNLLKYQKPLSIALYINISLVLTIGLIKVTLTKWLKILLLINSPST
jgi:hypothetical protein